MKSLSNTTKLALLIFCVIAIAMRFVGHMNLQAVGALAIFSGAVISPLWLAMIVPVAVMLVSDLAGVGFHWQTASLVYPSYMLAVFLARQWVSGGRVCFCDGVFCHVRVDDINNHKVRKLVIGR